MKSESEKVASSTLPKITKPVLVKENGFLFVKYVNENGNEVEVELEEDFDFNNILQEVRDERIDKILELLQINNDECGK